MLKEDTAYIKRSIDREVWRAARSQALKEDLNIGQWIEKVIKEKLKSIQNLENVPTD